MLDYFKILFNDVPEPSVGDILVDKVWGDYNKIEIVRISENKKEVLYKFLKVKGTTAISGDSYSGNWKYLYTDVYKKYT